MSISLFRGEYYWLGENFAAHCINLAAGLAAEVVTIIKIFHLPEVMAPPWFTFAGALVITTHEFPEILYLQKVWLLAPRKA